MIFYCTWTSGKLPFDVSKTCLFFFKLSKILKKMSIFGNFLTGKWQFSEGQIGTKCDKSETFRRAKMYWCIMIFKSPRFVQDEANMTHLGTNSDIPVFAESGHTQLESDKNTFVCSNAQKGMTLSFSQFKYFKHVWVLRSVFNTGK